MSFICWLQTKSSENIRGSKNWMQHTHMCISRSLYIYNIFLYKYISVYISVHVYMYIYIYIYMCMYILCTYISIYIRSIYLSDIFVRMILLTWLIYFPVISQMPCISMETATTLAKTTTSFWEWIAPPYKLTLTIYLCIYLLTVTVWDVSTASWSFTATHSRPKVIRRFCSPFLLTVSGFLIDRRSITENQGLGVSMWYFGGIGDPFYQFPSGQKLSKLERHMSGATLPNSYIYIYI